MKEKTLIAKTAKMSMYHKTKTKNTKQRRKKAEEGKKKRTKRREETMKKTEMMQIAAKARKVM
jgi:hypothetical protein